ncbi:hypothetical protein B0H13DRAFT_2276551 [Mycena leptocephala]|nr:hypothetical protein B0H13DRAFT_2276551 [Mycena leptocephala]
MPFLIRRGPIFPPPSSPCGCTSLRRRGLKIVLRGQMDGGTHERAPRKQVGLAVDAKAAGHERWEIVGSVSSGKDRDSGVRGAMRNGWCGRQDDDSGHGIGGRRKLRWEHGVRGTGGEFEAVHGGDVCVMYESRENSMYHVFYVELCDGCGRDIAERWRKASDEAPVNQMMSAGLGARSSFLATATQAAMTDENCLYRIYCKCWKFCVAIWWQSFSNML